ncbi:MAG TPA: RNA polymerase sigma factor [Saprospiraceae bacterium]|nr:RNA polymerase sigma factor [Saprospiraceae bacterium]
MLEKSDETILNLLLSGVPTNTERGLRMMMEKYQERLYWVIRRIVAQHEDANDVLQNCFIKAYRSIHTFEQKAKLYTWLYRIATNEAITHLNKQKKTAVSSLDDEMSYYANRLSGDTFFDSDAVQQHLQRAIEKLPDKQKLVFNMRYFEELAYEEMSEILGTSVGALKASFHHAVKKIEAYFNEKEIF